MVNYRNVLGYILFIESINSSCISGNLEQTEYRYLCITFCTRLYEIKTFYKPAALSVKVFDIILFDQVIFTFPFSVGLTFVDYCNLRT